MIRHSRINSMDLWRIRRTGLAMVKEVRADELERVMGSWLWLVATWLANGLWLARDSWLARSWLATWLANFLWLATWLWLVRTWLAN